MGPWAPGRPPGGPLAKPGQKHRPTGSEQHGPFWGLLAGPLAKPGQNTDPPAASSTGSWGKRRVAQSKPPFAVVLLPGSPLELLAGEQGLEELNKLRGLVIRAFSPKQTVLPHE